MSDKLIIKNGKIVTAIDQYNADILIENERIKCIGENGINSFDVASINEIKLIKKILPKARVYRMWIRL